MESTGVYWIPLFELLEARGFTVLLVNARHVKNVSGRKSDVLDCQWLQQLINLRAAARGVSPGRECLRACARSSASAPRCLRSQARHVQHMQKALTQMNIQLDQRHSPTWPAKRARGSCAPSSPANVTAKLWRRSEECARSRQRRRNRPAAFKATGALSTCSLSSRHWTLVRLRRHPAGRMRPRRSSCNCKPFSAHDGNPAKGQEARTGPQRPKIRPAHAAVQRCAAWTSPASTASMSPQPWPSSPRPAPTWRAFPPSSTLRPGSELCPGTKITGGKVLSGKTKRVANRAAQALRMAAAGSSHQPSPPSARTSDACALGWTSPRPLPPPLTRSPASSTLYSPSGDEYTDQGQDYYEQRYRDRVLQSLSQRAAKLGMRMVPLDQPA